MQLIKRFGLRIFKDIYSSFHSFYIYSAPHCFAYGMLSTKVWLSFVAWMGHHTVKFVFFFSSNGWVQLSVTPYTAACQASLSITISQNSVSIESVILSNQSYPLSLPSPPLTLSQHQGLFHCVSFAHQVAKGLELEH